jgi:hypothetical protein
MKLERITPSISGGRDPVRSILSGDAGVDGDRTINPVEAGRKAQRPQTFGTIRLQKRLLKAFAAASGMSMFEIRAGLAALEAKGFLRRPDGAGKVYELTVPNDGEARS